MGDNAIPLHDKSIESYNQRKKHQIVNAIPKTMVVASCRPRP